jgi:hypothetical protein
VDVLHLLKIILKKLLTCSQWVTSVAYGECFAGTTGKLFCE